MQAIFSLSEIPQGPLKNILVESLENTSVGKSFQRLNVLRLVCKKLNSLIKTTDEQEWLARIIVQNNPNLAPIEQKLNLNIVFSEKYRLLLESTESLNLKGTTGLTKGTVRKILNFLPQLTKLKLPNSGETEGLSLENIYNLELSLPKTVSYRELNNELTNVNNSAIHELTISNAHLDQNQAEHLNEKNQYTNVKKLTLSNMKDEATHFHLLANFLSIEALRVVSCQGFGIDQSSTLANLPQLKKLVFERQPIACETIQKILADCPQVREIQLVDCKYIEDPSEFQEQFNNLNFSQEGKVISLRKSIP